MDAAPLFTWKPIRKLPVHILCFILSVIAGLEISIFIPNTRSSQQLDKYSCGQKSDIPHPRRVVFSFVLHENANIRLTGPSLAMGVLLSATTAWGKSQPTCMEMHGFGAATLMKCSHLTKGPLYTCTTQAHAVMCWRKQWVISTRLLE